MTFLNSILKQSKKYDFPFDHWEYNNALSDETIQEIITADIPDVSKHNLTYDGTRAIDGGAAELFLESFRRLKHYYIPNDQMENHTFLIVLKSN